MAEGHRVFRRLRDGRAFGIVSSPDRIPGRGRPMEQSRIRDPGLQAEAPGEQGVRGSEASMVPRILRDQGRTSAEVGQNRATIVCNVSPMEGGISEARRASRTTAV